MIIDDNKDLNNETSSKDINNTNNIQSKLANVAYGEILEVGTNCKLALIDFPCVLGNSKIISNNESQYLKTQFNLQANQKMCINSCSCIGNCHAIIYYDNKENKLKLKSIIDCYINLTFLNYESEPYVLKNFDKLIINCYNHSYHIFVLIFPNLQNLTNNNIVKNTTNNNIIVNKKLNRLGLIGSKLNIKPDLKLSNSWSLHEKDCLRKYLLVFGYNKWHKIQVNSNRVLKDKPHLELRLFSNSFIRVLVDLLSSERKELKKFLTGLIIQKSDEPYVISKKDDWGSLIKQRAPAWGKRIQLIWRISVLIEKFKSERNKNKEIREKNNAKNLSNENEETNDNNVNKTFDNWDNLLNFLPGQAFYGQRPAVWWTRTHDIDLLRGTYKYGYANYQLMRSDQKYIFSKFEKESSNNLQEFPSADTITRRLKKLVQIIVKYEQSNNGVISFCEKVVNKDPTGFSLDYKYKILSYLIDKGVPLTSEGKYDWFQFKSDVENYFNYNNTNTNEKDNNNKDEDCNNKDSMNKKHSAQSYERLVQRLRIMAQVIIDIEAQNNDEQFDDNKLNDLDPDNDNFTLEISDAENLNKNMNMLSFIRKYIIASNYKIFNTAVNGQELDNSNMPDNYDPDIHDRQLLKSIDNYGFSSLNNLFELDSFKNLNINKDKLINRLSYLCEFFKEYTSNSKAKKKKEHLAIQNDIINNSIKLNIDKKEISSYKDTGYYKKKSKVILKKDSFGNIIYPVIISSSLKIINFGSIVYDRLAYHSEKNLFPVGFISIREHTSMINPNSRCEYMCEILDGGLRPKFKVTCKEDEYNPIIKDTCTGCWIVVCNKINDIQKNRKSKVTISGTDRFGISEPSVSKILQTLEGVEKCMKYNWKYFEDIN